MLILSRRQDERVIITTPQGETIQVVVVDSTKGTTHLGIDALNGYRILRDELVLNKKPYWNVRGVWSVEDYFDLLLHDFVESLNQEPEIDTSLPEGFTVLGMGDGIEIILKSGAEHGKPYR